MLHIEYHLKSIKFLLLKYFNFHFFFQITLHCTLKFCPGFSVNMNSFRWRMIFISLNIYQYRIIKLFVPNGMRIKFYISLFLSRHLTAIINNHMHVNLNWMEICARPPRSFSVSWLVKWLMEIIGLTLILILNFAFNIRIKVNSFTFWLVSESSDSSGLTLIHGQGYTEWVTVLGGRVIHYGQAPTAQHAGLDPAVVIR